MSTTRRRSSDGGQQVRHALVYESGFFPARDDINGKAQYLDRPRQKNVAVSRFAQGLGGNRTHLMGFESGQSLAKAGQTIPSVLHGLGGKVTLVVHASALADGFFQVFGTLKRAVGDDANFQAETIRAQVDGGQAGGRGHGKNVIGPNRRRIASQAEGATMARAA